MQGCGDDKGQAAKPESKLGQQQAATDAAAKAKAAKADVNTVFVELAEGKTHGREMSGSAVADSFAVEHGGKIERLDAAKAHSYAESMTEMDDDAVARLAERVKTLEAETARLRSRNLALEAQVEQTSAVELPPMHEQHATSGDAEVRPVPDATLAQGVPSAEGEAGKRVQEKEQKLPTEDVAAGVSLHEKHEAIAAKEDPPKPGVEGNKEGKDGKAEGAKSGAPAVALAAAVFLGSA